MSEATKKTADKPVKTIRHGAIAANIWKRQAPSGFEYYDFSLLTIEAKEIDALLKKLSPP
ncbi:MAG: hypothetical protein KDA72_22025 [Planctomycetales bacterium]|nr:hypothetical protein [Planctomycetales bacterium]